MLSGGTCRPLLPLRAYETLGPDGSNRPGVALFALGACRAGITLSPVLAWSPLLSGVPLVAFWTVRAGRALRPLGSGFPLWAFWPLWAGLSLQPSLARVSFGDDKV